MHSRSYKRLVARINGGWPILPSHIIRLLIVVMLIVVSACAVQPVKTIQTSSELHIDLSGSDDGSYVLVNTANDVIASTKATEKKITFKIPAHSNINKCVTVVNEKGKSLYGDAPWFYLTLINDFRTTSTDKRNLEVQLAGHRSAESLNRQKYTESFAKLESNRAYRDRTCYLPVQAPLPKEPYTKCRNENECRTEGAAICFTRYLGLEGCSQAAKRFGIDGWLSGPSCGAAAAELAREKYDLNDAVVDALSGMADDLGNELQESESFLEKVFGTLIKGANLGVKRQQAEICTAKFIDTHYGAKKAWHAEVSRIRAEPQQSLDTCYTLIRDINQCASNVKHHVDSQEGLSKQLNEVNAVYEKLAREQREVQVCQ